ncbi:MAG TPA: hypothetical protein VLG10_06290 [Methylomirabilota bacterium]|nr:hypothetical protein [Methylomirabilota bacterium]
MRLLMYTASVLLSLLLLVAVGPGTTAWAGPADDRLLPADQHSSDKARRLAKTHARALRDLSAGVYHCLPWLELHKQSIGFFRPKDASQDERYLSLRVYIEQDASPQFARLGADERAAAMFSRYVGPLLKRMGSERTLLDDPDLDGFTVILDWTKPAPRAASEQPITETIAVFIKKAMAAEYLAGRVPVGRLAEARILAWDGETARGQMRVTAWEDDFVATYKVANYQLDKGVSCPSGL